MHEMSITQSIVDAIVEHAEGTVTAVRLQVGKLSGVLPDAVRFCFDVAAVGTVAEGARLEITEPAGRARCRLCAAKFELDDPIVLCACGSADVEVFSGRELVIQSLEVAR